VRFQRGRHRHQRAGWWISTPCPTASRQHLCGRAALPGPAALAAERWFEIWPRSITCPRTPPARCPEAHAPWASCCAKCCRGSAAVRACRQPLRDAGWVGNRWAESCRSPRGETRAACSSMILWRRLHRWRHGQSGNPGCGRIARGTCAHVIRLDQGKHQSAQPSRKPVVTGSPRTKRHCGFTHRGQPAAPPRSYIGLRHHSA